MKPAGYKFMDIIMYAPYLVYSDSIHVEVYWVKVYRIPRSVWLYLLQFNHRSQIEIKTHLNLYYTSETRGWDHKKWIFLFS